MKIRIKFAKTGSVRFIGHLDIMRYFQKLMRRSGMDICYSQGFSPHQIMTFAAPLGVGLESLGEYMDIEVNTVLSSDEAIQTLNEQSTNEIRILQYRLLPDNAKNAMASVAAADYRLILNENAAELLGDRNLAECFQCFMGQDKIEIQREGKKTTQVIDIRPWILEYRIEDPYTIFLKILTGSSANLKPESVLEALFRFLGLELPFFPCRICRLEVYGLKPESGKCVGDGQPVLAGDLITLGDFGEDIK